MIILLLPPDAADGNAAGSTIFGLDRFEVGRDDVALLAASELDKSATVSELLLCPILGHGLKLAVELQIGLHGARVWVEGSGVVLVEAGMDGRMIEVHG